MEDQPIEEAVSEPKNEAETEDTYMNLNSVLNLATIANVLAWIVLTIAVLLWVFYLYLQFPQMRQLGLITVYIIGISTPILLLGGFFFVLLRAVAEGLYVLLDIQENTKSKA